MLGPDRKPSRWTRPADIQLAQRPHTARTPVALPPNQAQAHMRLWQARASPRPAWIRATTHLTAIPFSSRAGLPARLFSRDEPLTDVGGLLRGSAKAGPSPGGRPGPQGHGTGLRHVWLPLCVSHVPGALRRRLHCYRPGAPADESLRASCASRGRAVPSLAAAEAAGAPAGGECEYARRWVRFTGGRRGQRLRWRSGQCFGQHGSQQLHASRPSSLHNGAESFAE